MTGMNCKRISNDLLNGLRSGNRSGMPTSAKSSISGGITDVYIRDIELQSTKVEKDIGVYVDEERKFHQHISFTVNKSSRILWLIKKIFSYLDEDTLPRLYKALVRPHLEYGNIIWHPYYQMDKFAVVWFSVE